MPAAIDEALRVAVLAPYKPHCRYVERARVAVAPADADHLVAIHGELSITESCYIDDTGHFNSVEFNICYNQLVYLLMAHCVQAGLLDCFAGWTVDEYLRRQLPDVLIHDFGSRFRRPLRTEQFAGTVEIVAARELRRFLLLNTRCRFHDEQGGEAHGEVTLAIVDRGAGEA